MGPPAFSGCRERDRLGLFLHHAVWESAAHFRAAFYHPDFKRALGHYPSSVVASPHLFSRVAVPNSCTGW
jgi:hypothetical protein